MQPALIIGKHNRLGPYHTLIFFPISEKTVVENLLKGATLARGARPSSGGAKIGIAETPRPLSSRLKPNPDMCFQRGALFGARAGRPRRRCSTGDETEALNGRFQPRAAEPHFSREDAMKSSGRLGETGWRKKSRALPRSVLP
jgi:hypothetical protein